MNRETFQAIRDLLMEKLDMSREMTDREILDEIDQLILNRMRDSYISLNEKLQLRQELFLFGAQAGCTSGTDRG